MSKFNDNIIKAKNKSAHKRNITALAPPKKYSHIDFTPPQGVQEAAKKALEIRQEKPSSQRGGTPVGVARARDLANARQLTPDTIKRMYSYFSRHEVDKKAEGWDNWSKGKQAWYLWGGDAGFTWATKVVNQMKAADEKVTALSENITMESTALQEPQVPSASGSSKQPELKQGSPLLVLTLGQSYSKFSGQPYGSQVTKDVLRELVRTFKMRENAVIIDWEHASSSFVNQQPSSPDVGMALGEVIDVYLDKAEENLYIVPAYTKSGVEVVAKSDGVLWTSPEFAVGDIYSKNDGKKMGSASLLAVTLTPRPQQPQSKIQRVLLSEKITQMKELPMPMDPKELEGKTAEELTQMVLSKDSLVVDLEKKVQDMKAAYDQLQADHEAMMAELEQGSMSEENQMPIAPVAMGEKKQQEMNAMSEKIAKELNAQITAMSEQIAQLKKANFEAEKKMAVDALLQAGKIAPSEVAVASQAYEAKASTPAFWNLFSERKPAAAVPLQTIGHSATGTEVNLLSEAQALQASKKITLAQAIAEIRQTRPDVYSNYYNK